MIARRMLLASMYGLAVAEKARALGTEGPGLASLPIPDSRLLAFQLVRDGSSIGTHTLNFEVVGDMLTVDITVNVVLHLGPIPIVRYTHHAVESWQGGRIVSLRGQTNRNGTDMSMSAHRVADGLWVEGTGTRPYIAPLDALPTTYWNERMLHGPMIGTQDGGLVHPKVTPKGSQLVRMVSGVEHVATCYSLTGDLDLDLWYDADRRWMSMRFSVADGSIIRYEKV